MNDRYEAIFAPASAWVPPSSSYVFVCLEFSVVMMTIFSSSRFN